MINTEFGKARKNGSGHYRITSTKEGNWGKLLHRLIFENYHKCTILPNIDCHHVNGNKTDNRVDNLMLMPHGEHSKHHNTGDSNPRARKGIKLSNETKNKISKANKGKKLKPEPHIVKGGITSAGNRSYRLIVDSKIVMYSTDYAKLVEAIKTGSYKSYKKQKKYDIDLKELYEKYESGKTMAELGELYGCSRKTISRRLNLFYSKDQIGLHRRNAISEKLTNRNRVNLPPYEKLMELKKHHKYSELASMFNCSERTIYTRLKKKVDNYDE